MKKDLILETLAEEKEAKQQSRAKRKLSDVSVGEELSPLFIDPSVKSNANVIRPEDDQDWKDVRRKG